MRRRFWIAVVLSAGPGLGLAGTARAQNHWGAVAAGVDGTTAQAIAQPTREAARAAAIKECAGRCAYLVTFYRACGAIALRAGGYGWSVYSSEQLAGDHALRFCSDRGQDCRLRVAACSGND